VSGWLSRGFGLVNQLIGSSLVVTRNNCNTFKITVIITYTSGLLFSSLANTLHQSLNCLQPSWTLHTLWLNKVKVILRLTVSQSVSKSRCRAPSGAHDQKFITVWQLRSCFCEAPSLMRGRVCLVYAAGPCQRSLSRVRDDSRPYFTVPSLWLNIKQIFVI
jgi:hypothetical protein